MSDKSTSVCRGWGVKGQWRGQRYASGGVKRERQLFVGSEVSATCLLGQRSSPSLGVRSQRHLSVRSEVSGVYPKGVRSHLQCLRESEVNGRMELLPSRGEEPEGCMSEELQVVQQCGGNMASNIWKSFQTVCEGRRDSSRFRLPPHVHIPM